MTKKTNALIPEIRFPEFENGWKWEKDIIDNLISKVTVAKKSLFLNYNIYDPIF